MRDVLRRVFDCRLLDMQRAQEDQVERKKEERVFYAHWEDGERGVLVYFVCRACCCCLCWWEGECVKRVRRETWGVSSSEDPVQEGIHRKGATWGEGEACCPFLEQTSHEGVGYCW